jgi:hypothetical protein
MLLREARVIDSIERTAESILGQAPGAVVRYRLLRDVLKRPADAADLRQPRAKLADSLCVQELGREQWEDGGWGAFHSRSTKLKQKIASTEVGVERAISLGLDASHPILQRASAYLLSIMEGTRPFPDYPEKNDRWRTGVRLFLASTLSLIHPAHPALDDDRRLWREIAARTFRSGRYREQDEMDAHAELTGATVKDSYLVLNNRYSLNVLGSKPKALPEEPEGMLLRWLWEHPSGIGYLEIPLSQPPPAKSGPLDRWFASLEMLARLFPGWVRFARPAVEWLREQRGPEGFWDFGPKPSSVSFLPLSDDWRSRQNRLFDWTTRTLVLLRKYYDGMQRC